MRMIKTNRLVMSYEGVDYDVTKGFDRYAKSREEIELVNFLRRQACDRRPDAIRGGPYWYLIRCKAGDEVILTIRLLKIGIKAFCPREWIVEKKPRGKGKRLRRIVMFPGYVFVLLTPGYDSYAGVLTVDGVHGFLPTNENPSSVTPAEFKVLQELSRAKPHRKQKQLAIYLAGERIRIVDGPFAGFPGVVSAPDDERGRLWVDVSVFGRETPVHFELDQIQKLR